MKFRKISTLIAYAILLLAAGLLLGCEPPIEPKEQIRKSKEIITEPAQSESELTEPVINIDEKEDVESLKSSPGTSGEAGRNEESAQEDTAPDLMVVIIEDQEPVIDDATEVVAATPEIIRNVQQALVSSGFNPGPVDGVSGARTVIAIERFQKQKAIAAGQGKLTRETLRALGVDFQERLKGTSEIQVSRQDKAREKI